MTKKYKTVVIDPPWPINFRSAQRVNKVRETEEGKHGYIKEANYECCTLEDIFDFPINDFAQDACLLFLWVTNGKIEGRSVIDIGFDILDRWAFKYHQMITWVKHQGVAVFSPIRTITEHILFAWRGNFRELVKICGVIPSAFTTGGYQTKHSEKPPDFYRLLRKWTPKPRIDIFARRAHIGFDGWGDEYVGDGPLSEWIE